MSTDQETLQPVSVLTNLWDILTAPSLALRRVSTVQPRSWWFPALLAYITPLLYVGLTMDLQVAQAEKAVARQLSTMPPEQVETARALMERMTQPSTIFFTHAGSTLVALLLAWAVAMLILYFGISLLGTSVQTNGLWAAVVWTWVPLALRPLVQLVWSLISGHLLLYQGLSYFVASGDMLQDTKNPLFLAAAQIDPFNLWHLVLIYLLLRVVGRLGRGSSLGVTIFYALILGGVHLIPAFTSRLIG